MKELLLEIEQLEERIAPTCTNPPSAALTDCLTTDVSRVTDQAQAIANANSVETCVADAVSDPGNASGSGVVLVEDQGCVLD